MSVQAQILNLFQIYRDLGLTYLFVSTTECRPTFLTVSQLCMQDEKLPQLLRSTVLRHPYTAAFFQRSLRQNTPNKSRIEPCRGILQTRPICLQAVLRSEMCFREFKLSSEFTNAGVR